MESGVVLEYINRFTVEFPTTECLYRAARGPPWTCDRLARVLLGDAQSTS